MGRTVESLKDKSATELMIMHGGMQRVETAHKSRWMRSVMLWLMILGGIGVAQCGVV